MVQQDYRHSFDRRHHPGGIYSVAAVGIFREHAPFQALATHPYHLRTKIAQYQRRAHLDQSTSWRCRSALTPSGSGSAGTPAWLLLLTTILCVHPVIYNKPSRINCRALCGASNVYLLHDPNLARWYTSSPRVWDVYRHARRRRRSPANGVPIDSLLHKDPADFSQHSNSCVCCSWCYYFGYRVWGRVLFVKDKFIFELILTKMVIWRLHFLNEMDLRRVFYLAHAHVLWEREKKDGVINLFLT